MFQVDDDGQFFIQVGPVGWERPPRTTLPFLTLRRFQALRCASLRAERRQRARSDSPEASMGPWVLRNYGEQ